MNIPHIVKVTEVKLFAKFHDDWSKQSDIHLTFSQKKENRPSSFLKHGWDTSLYSKSDSEDKNRSDLFFGDSWACFFCLQSMTVSGNFIFLHLTVKHYLKAFNSIRKRTFSTKQRSIFNQIARRQTNLVKPNYHIALIVKALIHANTIRRIMDKINLPSAFSKTKTC